jgi:hypothetical protein
MTWLQSNDMLGKSTFGLPGSVGICVPSPSGHRPRDQYERGRTADCRASQVGRSDRSIGARMRGCQTHTKGLDSRSVSKEQDYKWPFSLAVHLHRTCNKWKIPESNLAKLLWIVERLGTSIGWSARGGRGLCRGCRTGQKANRARSSQVGCGGGSRVALSGWGARNPSPDSRPCS